MSTKVKGEAIKEGSIPLSALSNEVKGKIENASGANWNAQEGDAGYIENKPFYDKGDIRQIDVNGEYEICVDGLNIGDRIDISWDLEYYNGEVFEVFRGSASFVIQAEHNHNTYYYKDDFGIFGREGEDGLSLILYAHNGADSHYGKVTVVVNGEIKTLDDKYLPNTVLKTTPQTLSDTDKNQALANLGIDPVVLKYMLNPIVITSLDDRLPTDILKDDGTGIAMILPKYAGLIRGGYDSRKQQYVNACAVKSEENGFYYTVYIGGELNINASIDFDGSLYYDDI